MHLFQRMTLIAEFLLVCPFCWGDVPISDIEAPASTMRDFLPDISSNAAATAGIDSRIIHFEQLASSSPSDAMFHLYLGELYLGKAIRLRQPLEISPSAQAQQYLDHAGEEFGKVVALEPTNSHVYFLRATTSYELGQFTNAVADMDRVVAGFPSNSLAWHCRGVALRSAGRPEESAESFRKAIEFNTNALPSYLDLAQTYINLNRFNDAISVSSNAFSRFPENPQVLRIMALSLTQGGQSQKTVALCRAILEKNPDNVEARYRLGQALINLGDSDEGVRELKRVLEIDPRKGNAYNELGLLYMDQGKYEEAKTQFEAALQIFPLGYSPLHNLGVCYLKGKEYEKALGFFERALQINPGYEPSLLCIIQTYEAKGQLDAAKQLAERIVAMMPSSADAYNTLASVYFQMGDFPSSLDTYQQSRVRNPNDPLVWANIGRVLYKEGRPADACQMLAKAIELKSRDAWTYVLYAEILRASGQFTPSMEICNAALSLFPTNVDVCIEAGKVSGMNKRWSDSLRAYQLAQQYDSNSVEAVYGIGQALNALGRRGEAVDALTRALAQEPTNSLYRCSLSEVLFKAGNRQEARRVLDEGLTLNPTDVGVFNGLGSMSLQENDPAAAVDVLQKAVAAGPKNSTTRYLLGTAFWKLGQPDLAISNWEAVATSDPSFPWVHSSLASAYRQSGRLVEALMEYQEYSRRLPEDAAAHNDLGYTYYRLRRFDEAVSEYETSLKLNPKAGLAYYNLALVYYAEGDKTNALDACLKAVANGYSGDPKFIAALHASETK